MVQVPPASGSIHFHSRCHRRGQFFRQRLQFVAQRVFNALSSRRPRETQFWCKIQCGYIEPIDTMSVCQPTQRETIFQWWMQVRKRGEGGVRKTVSCSGQILDCSAHLFALPLWNLTVSEASPCTAVLHPVSVAWRCHRVYSHCKLPSWALWPLAGQSSLNSPHHSNAYRSLFRLALWHLHNIWIQRVDMEHFSMSFTGTMNPGWQDVQMKPKGKSAWYCSSNKVGEGVET